MELKKVNTPYAPAAIGPYSQGIIAGNIVYTSGAIPLDAASGEVVGTDVAAQTEQVLKNLAAVLEEAGSGLNGVIKTTCFLTDMAHFADFNKVYERYMVEKPARSCVAVRALPKGVLVEVEAVALIG